MATLWDIQATGIAKSVITFILVYVIIWGFLTSKKIFSSQSVSSLIALCAALLFTLSDATRFFLEFVAPWYTLFIIIFFFIIFIFMMFGATDKSITAALMHKEQSLLRVLIGVSMIILIFGLVNTYQHFKYTPSVDTRLEETRISTNPTTTTTTVLGNNQGVENNQVRTDNQAIKTSGGGVFLKTNTEPAENSGTTSNTGQSTTTSGGVVQQATPNVATLILGYLFSPNILGILILILIVFFTILLLARPQWY